MKIDSDEVELTSYFWLVVQGLLGFILLNDMILGGTVINRIILLILFALLSFTVSVFVKNQNRIPWVRFTF